MSDGSVVEPDPDEVGARLVALSESPLLVHHAQQLRRLSGDLHDLDRAALWAETDLTSMFVVDDQSRDADLETPRVRRVEAARAILIFLPLLITWLGIALATRAYAAVEAKSSSSFIALWEQGFPGYEGFVLKLSHVALLDVAAIGALIACTLYVQVERGRVERRVDAQVHLARSGLAAALVDASWIAAKGKFSSPERFQTLLNDSAGEFANLVDGLGTVVARADTVLQNLSTAGTALVAAGTSLDSSAAAAATVATDLAAAANALPGPLAGLDRSMAGLDSSISGHSAALVQSSGSLRSTLDSLSAASDAARQQLEELSPLVGKVLALETDLVGKVQQTLTDQQKVAAGVADAAVQVASMQQSSSSAASAAAQATQQALTASQQFVSQIGQSLAGVQGLGAAQAEFAELLRTTNASVEVGVNRLRTDLEQLHLVLQWLSDLGSDEVPRS
jgi:hypothetical protein